MKGLIIKDFISLKKYSKQFLLMIAVFAIFGISMKSPSYIAFMFMLFGSMTIITSMSYDESAGWNKMAFCMPISKSEVVKAKYLTWIVLTLITFLFSVIFGGMICLYLGQNMLEFIASLLAVTSVYLILFSIIIPILFRLGMEKGRMIMLAVFLIPTIFIMGAARVLERAGVPELAISENAMILFLILFTVIAIIVSYFVSVKIVTRREW